MRNQPQTGKQPVNTPRLGSQAEAGNFGPIEIFRVGQFKDMGGADQIVTRQNLSDIARIYDPETSPAPVVIGHPNTDAPAFGWVDRLWVEGDILKATIREAVPEFSEAVKAGRYKRVSISLFLPSSSANPMPGQLYIRHVGFLGAQAPAVPGLKPVRFSDADAAGFAISQAFATPPTPDQIELAALRKDAMSRRIEALIEKGQVLPVFKEEVLNFAAHLGNSDTVSFSDGAQVQAGEWFLDYLAKQPAIVNFGQLDLPPAYDNLGGGTGVSVPEGYSVDQRNSDLAAQARAISREKGISFADALDTLEGQWRT